MIEYIKEYGITSIDYEYILHNVSRDVIQCMALSEDAIREILDFYNHIGITSNISKIIINRPDLIITSKENLKETISKIDLSIFVNIVDKSIEDLILLGI